MTTQKCVRAERIAELNDRLRKQPMNRSLGSVLITAGLNANGPSFVAQVLAAISAMAPEDFKTGNDPYGERDFNSFKAGNCVCMFKIDYYAKDDPHSGSDDPSDPAKTDRVMTVMLASDY